MKNYKITLCGNMINEVMRYLVLVVLIFSVISCNNDDGVEDNRVPTISVDGISMDQTVVSEFSSEGYKLNMIIADNVGLNEVLIEVDSASNVVETMSIKNFKYKLEHKSVTFSNLSTDYLYDVKITLTDVNSNSNNFNFKLQLNDFKRYDYLGLVGDATLAGWNPSASEAMTQDPNDPAIFTYTGPLAANGEGAFKIATFVGDWCNGEWLYASEANKSITESDGFVINGCGGPDNKWKVTEETAGDYLITVNLREKSISFEKQ